MTDRKMTGKLNGKTNRKKVIAAVMACMALLSCGAAAAAQESRIAKALETDKDISPYIQPVGQTLEQGGCAVTLEEVLISEDRVYAAVSVEKDDFQGTLAEACISVADRNCEMKGVSFQSSGLENGRQEWFLVMILRNPQDLEQAADMEMQILAYENAEDAKTRENALSFDFSFEVSRTALEEKTLRIPLEERVELKDGKRLELEKLVLTPVDSRIEGRLYGADTTENSDCVLEGTDSMGNSDYVMEGTDSMGNSVSYSFSSYEGGLGQEGDIVFEAGLQSGMMPSEKSEWISLKVREGGEYLGELQIDMKTDV